MGKRILVICCTPYQLLTAAQVLACYYPGEEADLILSDQMSGAQKLWEQAKGVWPYGRVYYLEERRLNRLAHVENAKNILLGAVAPEKLLERFLHLEGSYDVFLFSNISLMNQYLILALKRRNPRLQWLLFEDGAATYSQQVGGLVHSTSPKVCVQLHQVQKLQGMYLFHPETLDWKPGCPVHQLPQAYAPATLELLNRLFRYDKLGDRYDFPVVFFEESYPCDGVDIGDVALLDRVAKLVGKENVLVKTHPRNQVNRFALAGYRTNQDPSVPWELVALNHSFAGTVFLTVGSSAATNPWCVLGIPAKAVFLWELVEEPSKLRWDVLEQTKRLCQANPELFFCPKTWEECESLLSQLAVDVKPAGLLVEGLQIRGAGDGVQGVVKGLAVLP